MPHVQEMVQSFKPWVMDLIEECAHFPNGAHDDQVDTMTQVLIRWTQAQQQSTFASFSRRVVISRF